MSNAALYFPAIGAALGAVTGVVLSLFEPHLGAPIASLIALTILLLLTGALHEDGLADVADACRAGRSRETILRILKDSRIGTYGTLALIASFLLRWQALSRMRVNPVLGLIAALALSRTALVALAVVSPPVGDGLGASFIRDLPRPSAYGAILLGALLALLAAHFSGLIMIGFTALITAGARSYFLRRIGGVNGDCLGATCQIVETINLLISAWQPSI